MVNGNNDENYIDCLEQYKVKIDKKKKPPSFKPTRSVASMETQNADAIDEYYEKSTASIKRVNAYREMYGQILRDLDE